MAAMNFTAALDEVLRHEGGFSEHSKDPGGATMMGITLATYRAWTKNPEMTKAQLKAIPIEHVRDIYRRMYWDMIRGDDLPSGVDLAVFDYAVNSGPGKAARGLQAALGVPEDGVIGPVTLQHAMRADDIPLIYRICDERLAFLKSLKHWNFFKGGWSRRIESVRLVSVRWADEARGKPQITKLVQAGPVLPWWKRVINSFRHVR